MQCTKSLDNDDETLAYGDITPELDCQSCLPISIVKPSICCVLFFPDRSGRGAPTACPIEASLTIIRLNCFWEILWA